MNKRVAVALSGGVDSAVVALLLKQQGYHVVGLTGKMFNNIEADTIVLNAKKVADKIGIEHFVYDVSRDFEEKIVKYFTNSYKNGSTPNPCIMCNKLIKWGLLFDYAIEELNCGYIATGHYANIEFKENKYLLYPASDGYKDQLYFLFLLNQEHLARTLFPLSSYKKSEVRELALKYDLPPKSSKESQDICFIKAPMTTKKYLNDCFESTAGVFVEKKTGKVLGKHDGFWQFTIGQRKGIGIAAPEPLYVVDINSKENIVYVGCKDELFSQKLNIKDIHWSYPIDKKEFEALVKIRYNMQAERARVTQTEIGCDIEFINPISAITKGQACVIYDIQDQHLIGGGWIE